MIKTDITSLVQPGIAILSSVLFGINCLLRHNFMTLLSGLAKTFFVLMRNNIRTSFYFITKSDSVIYTRSFEGFWSCLPRLLDKYPIYFPCWFSGGKNKWLKYYDLFSKSIEPESISKFSLRFSRTYVTLNDNVSFFSKFYCSSNILEVVVSTFYLNWR